MFFESAFLEVCANLEVRSSSKQKKGEGNAPLFFARWLARDRAFGLYGVQALFFGRVRAKSRASFFLDFFPCGAMAKKTVTPFALRSQLFFIFFALRASACRWPKKSACTRLMATLNSAGGPRGHGRLVVRPLSPVAFPRTPTHATGGAGLTRQYCLRQLIAFARVRARVSVCVSI